MIRTASQRKRTDRPGFAIGSAVTSRSGYEGESDLLWQERSRRQPRRGRRTKAARPEDAPPYRCFGHESVANQVVHQLREDLVSQGERDRLALGRGLLGGLEPLDGHPVPRAEGDLVIVDGVVFLRR